jgi:putative PIN family toxin of toxin-antitoxin system
MPKAVFDSTILVSAFLAPQGISQALLHHAVRGAFELYLSEAILEETQEVLLTLTHLRKHYVYTDEQAREFCALLRGFAHVTALPASAPPVSRDPNDDMVIACAVAAQATYLVTRDKDLLTLTQYRKVRMTTPEQFIEIVRT